MMALKCSKLGLLAVLTATFFTGSLMAADGQSKLKVGDKAPAFTLKDIDGKDHSLNDYRGKIVIIEFDATRCPVSQAYDARMTKYVKDVVDDSESKIVWLAINSNENPLEDIAEIKEHAKKVGATYPILKDGDSKVADLYDAKVTPHMYIIDGEGVLRYKGAFDDSMNEEKVAKHYVEDAVKSLLAGEDVAVKETIAKGCTIKRP